MRRRLVGEHPATLDPNGPAAHGVDQWSGPQSLVHRSIPGSAAAPALTADAGSLSSRTRRAAPRGFGPGRSLPAQLADALTDPGHWR